ncbi:MAG TPA: carboxypeptidase-like regulatory domain-containing protein, partial [Puia sp.]|nr:carboxypeptidase-like regulatory domain-containing protein [Puia sp.]
MRNYLFLFVLIFSSYLAVGQKTVTGIIKDARSKQPLAGVSVKIKGKTTGTVTNNEGAFQLSASNGETIQISYVSYETMEISVGDLSNYSIFLQPNTSELSEIVFVGSRGAGRAKTETAVPVDVLKVNQIGLPTAKMDLTSVLNYAAPSFNYNKQSGA